MRHIYHEKRADRIGDLAKLFEIDLARIGSEASNNEGRFFALGDLFYFLIIKLLGFGVDTISDLLPGFAGDRNFVSVREMSAMRETHTHNLAADRYSR